MDDRRARAKAKAKAGNTPGNSSNHNNNAARGVRVAEESRGGVTPGNHPKSINEGVPPFIERIMGHQTLEPPQSCSPGANRIELPLEINSKLNNKSPPYLNPRNNIQWWRDHGAGADLLCAIQVGIKPTLTALPPANSRKCLRAPPLLNDAIAEYLALGVIRRMNQAGDPIDQALGPSIRTTQGGQRENSNDRRSASIEFRLGSTPQIQN